MIVWLRGGSDWGDQEEVEMVDVPRIGDTVVLGGERYAYAVTKVVHHARRLDSPQQGLPHPIVVVEPRP